MQKIKLGTRPKSFQTTVTVDLPEGEKGVIKVSFVYRTRTEFGKLMDEIFSDAGLQSAKSADDARASLTEAMKRTGEANTDYLLRIMDGWDLESEFNRANVAQLCDELPGAAAAIMDKYSSAIAGGRLGN